jgi:hypothetical protein
MTHRSELDVNTASALRNSGSVTTTVEGIGIFYGFYGFYGFYRFYGL